MVSSSRNGVNNLYHNILSKGGGDPFNEFYIYEYALNYVTENITVVIQRICLQNYIPIFDFSIILNIFYNSFSHFECKYVNSIHLYHFCQITSYGHTIYF